LLMNLPLFTGRAFFLPLPVFGTCKAVTQVKNVKKCLFVSLKFGLCWCLCWFVMRGNHCSFTKKYGWSSAAESTHPSLAMYCSFQARKLYKR
jgi:hypothetical protein